MKEIKNLLFDSWMKVFNLYFSVFRLAIGLAEVEVLMLLHWLDAIRDDFVICCWCLRIYCFIVRSLDAVGVDLRLIEPSFACVRVRHSA